MANKYSVMVKRFLSDGHTKAGAPQTTRQEVTADEVSVSTHGTLVMKLDSKVVYAAPPEGWLDFWIKE